jgi:hypothetical protein
VTASKVTLFPVPVKRERPEDGDPERLNVENERLRAENAVLKERLATVHAIALEREERIEDLRHALRMLPSVWAQKLEARLGGDGKDQARGGPEHSEPSTTPTPSPAPPADVEPEVPTAASGTGGVEEPQLERAEILMEEIAALRARLERRRLEVEREILEQERKSLVADVEWSRRWRRSRSTRPVSP